MPAKKCLYICDFYFLFFKITDYCSSTITCNILTVDNSLKTFLFVVIYNNKYTDVLASFHQRSFSVRGAGVDPNALHVVINPRPGTTVCHTAAVKHPFVHTSPFKHIN